MKFNTLQFFLAMNPIIRALPADGQLRFANHHYSRRRSTAANEEHELGRFLAPSSMSMTMLTGVDTQLDGFVASASKGKGKSSKAAKTPTSFVSQKCCHLELVLLYVSQISVVALTIIIYPQQKPTASPTVKLFPVSPFAVMGVTHTAIRGWIYQMEEDCLEAVENWTNKTKLNQTIATVETLLSVINPHMEQEDEKFFYAFDNTFDCIARNEGYREEHRHDENAQDVLEGFLKNLTDPGLTLSIAHEVCAETFTFASEHEAHLKHEEVVLQNKTAFFPMGSGPSIVHHVLMTNFYEIYGYFFATALTQLVKRESLTVVGTYVSSVKRVLNTTQYDLVLPSMMQACGDLWPEVEKRLSGGSYNATSDGAKLPTGIFNESSCVIA
jgi:hypothetical protein